MSRYDYLISKEIEEKDYPFYAILMGAMRQADSVNLNRLKHVFPDTYKELVARYNAGGGYLEGEIPENEEVQNEGLQSTESV